MQSSNGDRPLPYSEDTEKGVLCSLILAPKEAGEMCQRLLKAEYFFAPAHRITYEVLLGWQGVGQVEFPWLVAEIKNLRALDEVGGKEFLNELFTFIPTASNVGYYIEGVRDVWRRRCAVLLGHRLAEGADLTEIFEQLEIIGSDQEATFGLPSFESAQSLLTEDIPTPTEIVAGLIHQGSKVAIGGTSKSYKTWALINLALSVAAGKPWLERKTAEGKVLYVNLELSKGWFRRRLITVAKAIGLALDDPWSDVRMAHAGRSAGLSHKPPTGRFVADELGIDDLQRYRISKIYIERFVCHSHRTAAQFERRSVIAR
jgi:hypothetical protein